MYDLNFLNLPIRDKENPYTLNIEGIDTKFWLYLFKNKITSPIIEKYISNR
jgi:hypothetical protein